VEQTKAFVFDLDGTLATLPIHWEGVRERLSKLSGTPTDSRPIFMVVAEIIAKNPKIGKDVFAVIDEFESDALPSARLYDGSFQLLTKLSERANISLVTLQGHKAATRVLEMFDLRQFFSHYFTRESSLDRAEQVEMALAAMKAEKSSSMFVGDRLNDLNAAKKAGVPFTMIRTHGADPVEDDIPVYHSLAEFAATVS
jgi:HAD superfamily hydrolase (TIGR01549 family)